MIQGKIVVQGNEIILTYRDSNPLRGGSLSQVFPFSSGGLDGARRVLGQMMGLEPLAYVKGDPELVVGDRDGVIHHLEGPDEQG